MDCASADVRVDIGEKRKLGFFCWHRNARLCQQGEETEGLQRDGFTARVGAADDELFRVFRKDDGEWDRRLWFCAFCQCRCSHADLEKRMAGCGE